MSKLRPSLSDDELLKAIAVARKLAHDAPFAEWSKDHTGHSAIVNHTSAWSTRANEWMELVEEARRRGLPHNHGTAVMDWTPAITMFAIGLGLFILWRICT